MQIEKTEAIIINCTDWSDSSKIVAFYTKDHGRVKAVVKGAKRKNSPFRGALELFCLVDLVYSEKQSRELQVVTQCSIREHFPRIRKNIVKTAYCSYFAQMADEIGGGKEKSGELFNLLLEIFRYLEENGATGLLARYFEFNFLKAAGYKPLLKQCSVCGLGMEFPLRRAGFSPAAGGVICETCMDKNREFVLISGGALSTMLCLERVKADRLGMLQASSAIREELKEAMCCYLEYYLEKRLKSMEFLELVEEGGDYEC